MAKQPEVRAALDEALTRRLRDGNAEVDVVLVLPLATKKVSGFVGGKGGVGVAEVNNVEFQSAIQSSASWAKTTIHAQIGPTLPSLAAVKEIRARAPG